MFVQLKLGAIRNLKGTERGVNFSEKGQIWVRQRSGICLRSTGLHDPVYSGEASIISRGQGARGEVHRR